MHLVLNQETCQLEIRLARLIRVNNESSLLALFAPSGECVELTSTFIKVKTGEQEFPLGLLAQDTSGRQVWRQQAAAKKAAAEHFSNNGIDANHALECVVRKPPIALPKDMVYLRGVCRLAEVQSRECDKLTVLVAEEQSCKSAFAASFRFTVNSKQTVVCVSDVVFPIDLAFNKKEGCFHLSKSFDLDTV